MPLRKMTLAAERRAGVRGQAEAERLGTREVFLITCQFCDINFHRCKMRQLGGPMIPKSNAST